MSTEGVCALHADREAAFTCARCGDYGCGECARRSAPSAPPLCARCWTQRERGGTEGLKAWQGALTVVLVGIGAQIAGGVALMVALGVGVALGHTSLDDVASGHLTFALIGPSLVVTELAMVLGVLGAVLLARKPVRATLGLTRAPWPAFVAAPIGMLALGPTSDVLHRLMQTYLPTWTLGNLDALDAAARSAPVWIMAPLFGLLPGVAEELLFRGAFQRSIRTRWLAIVLSATFFAAYHTDPHHVVAVLPLGFYLAWLGDRTGSVLVPMSAHIVNNAFAVILTSLSDGEAPVPGLAGMEDVWMLPVGLVVGALAIAVVWWATRARAADEPVVAPRPELASAVPVEARDDASP